MNSELHHRRSFHTKIGSNTTTISLTNKQRLKNPKQYAAEAQILPIEYNRAYVTEIKIRNHSATTALMAGQATRHKIEASATAHNMVCGMVSIMEFSKDENQQLKALLERSSLPLKDLYLKDLSVNCCIVQS